jgi:hypothetical protein
LRTENELDVLTAVLVHPSSFFCLPCAVWALVDAWRWGRHISNADQWQARCGVYERVADAVELRKYDRGAAQGAAAWPSLSASTFGPGHILHLRRVRVTPIAPSRVMLPPHTARSASSHLGCAISWTDCTDARQLSVRRRMDGPPPACCPTLPRPRRACASSAGGPTGRGGGGGST